MFSRAQPRQKMCVAFSGCFLFAAGEDDDKVEGAGVEEEVSRVKPEQATGSTDGKRQRAQWLNGRADADERRADWDPHVLRRRDRSWAVKKASDVFRLECDMAFSCVYGVVFLLC